MNCLRLTRLILQPNIFRITSVKYISQHPVKFTETQDRWRERDNVSKRWELIYKAPMEKWLNYLSTYLTFSTSSIACAGIYYAAFVFDKSTMNDPVVIGEDLVIANGGIECLVYLGAFVALHVAVKVLLSKYVLRLYLDGDKYLAVFGGHLYNQINKHEFHIKDVKKLSPTFVVSWGDARFSLGNKHGILLWNYFKTPEYFNDLINKRSTNKANDD